MLLIRLALEARLTRRRAGLETTDIASFSHNDDTLFEAEQKRPKPMKPFLFNVIKITYFFERKKNCQRDIRDRELKWSLISIKDLT